MTSSLATLAAGLGIGLSLIVAIGAQNAFILRQGVIGRHVTAMIVVCVVSDAALILAGVGGMGSLLDRIPGALTALRYLGAAWLLGYGLLAARRAIGGPGSGQVVSGPGDGGDVGVGAGAGSLARTLAAALAFTWLNPHVYLDTVILLGSIAREHGPGGRWIFAAGAILASALWFGGLGFGAKRLREPLSRPTTWRILDGIIAVMMMALAASLLLGP